MQIPVLAGWIIDGLTSGQAKIYGWSFDQQEPWFFVYWAVIAISLIALLHGLSSYMYTMTGARLSQGFVVDTRSAVLGHYSRLPVSQLESFRSGEMISIILRDCSELRRYLDSVYIRMITNSIRVVYPLTMLFFIEAKLALIVLAILPLQMIISHVIQKSIHTHSQGVLEQEATLTGGMKEHIDGLETIKGMRAEDAMVDRVLSEAQSLEKAHLNLAHWTSSLRGSTWLITTLGLAVAWGTGATQVIQGVISIGELVAFIGFVEITFRPFRNFSQIAQVYRKGLAALERIERVLAIPTESQGGLKVYPSDRDSQSPHLNFRRVSLEHNGSPVLNELSVEFRFPGIYTIVGESGSGKSTLLRLLPRFIEPTSGRVEVGQRALREIPVDELRALMSTVGQFPWIFSGTLKENLLLARKDATDYDMLEALRQAGIDPGDKPFDLGLETKIGPNGIRLSGGQVQRLGIARSLLQGAKILLLDEPFSALDQQNSRSIYRTLEKLAQTHLILLVTHQLGSPSEQVNTYTLKDGRLKYASLSALT